MVRGRRKQTDSRRLPDARRFADPRRIADPSRHGRSRRILMGRAAKAASAAEPVPGYDKLKDKEAVASLREHSQVELARIDGYEQANQARRPIFDKLRWLRGNEPLPGYDQMDVDAVIVALDGQDAAGLKRVRGYERKFAARRDVLEEVERLHRERSGPLVSRDVGF